MPEPDAEPEISVVVPLRDEEPNLPELHRRLPKRWGGLGVPYELVFVDDGSRDATPALLCELYESDPHVVVLHLSRNFGHQPAISAGLEQSRGRAVVLMDGDLQDPPELIPALVARWREGHEVVYAVRRDRKESALKRLGYRSFYAILNAISDLPMPRDSGDFGLMDRRVVDALNGLPERMRFVRGLRAFVGFRQVGLPYERDARAAGRPKYTPARARAAAADGLVSFSSYPLRLVTYLGVAASAVALGLLVWVFADAFTHRTAPRGWASLIVVVLFMGSVQLVCLGIIGEYIRLIFLESKRRPTYIIRQRRSRGGDADRPPPG